MLHFEIIVSTCVYHDNFFSMYKPRRQQELARSMWLLFTIAVGVALLISVRLFLLSEKKISLVFFELICAPLMLDKLFNYNGTLSSWLSPREQKCLILSHRRHI